MHRSSCTGDRPRRRCTSGNAAEHAVTAVHAADQAASCPGAPRCPGCPTAHGQEPLTGHLGRYCRVPASCGCTGAQRLPQRLLGVFSLRSSGTHAALIYVCNNWQSLIMSQLLLLLALLSALITHNCCAANNAAHLGLNRSRPHTMAVCCIC